MVDANLQVYDAVQGTGDPVEQSASCAASHQSKQHKWEVWNLLMIDYFNTLSSCIFYRLADSTKLKPIMTTDFYS